VPLYPHRIHRSPCAEIITFDQEEAERRGQILVLAVPKLLKRQNQCQTTHQPTLLVVFTRLNLALFPWPRSVRWWWFIHSIDLVPNSMGGGSRWAVVMRCCGNGGDGRLPFPRYIPNWETSDILIYWLRHWFHVATRWEWKRPTSGKYPLGQLHSLTILVSLLWGFLEFVERICIPVVFVRWWNESVPLQPDNDQTVSLDRDHFMVAFFLGFYAVCGRINLGNC
jgi:hypothetical protein